VTGELSRGEGSAPTPPAAGAWGRAPIPAPRPEGGRRRHAPRGRGARLSSRSDQGVTAVEFAGWVPILLIVALAALQLGIVGYAALQAGSAARAAARTASQEEIADEAVADGKAAISLDATITIDPCGEEATATASVTILSVMPFIDNFGQATRSVTMPCD
jgi:Flp pilus assembly protein TadG